MSDDDPMRHVHVFLLDGNYDTISEPGSTSQAPDLCAIREGAPWQTLCLLLHADSAVWANARDLESVAQLSTQCTLPAAEHGRRT